MINESLKGFTPETRRSLAFAVINDVVHLGDFVVGQDVLYDEVAFKVYLKLSLHLSWLQFLLFGC